MTHQRLIFQLFCCLWVLWGCCALTTQPAAASQKTHTVFFEGEENELHVFRIKGEKSGKTLLIIGGIQGDEPAGFLAADFYADFQLEKGNLIVVPRANFPSILRNERQINQDMNRKFLDDNISNYEMKVVSVLKKLICESDCFLNLHEGSGIYSSRWENEQRNPQRYGQSIIADDVVLQHPETGQVIDLKEMASEVIEKINQKIDNESHHFHFNNHRTAYSDSLHKEQLKSATFFAYQVCKIPAFGVESTKSLPLEQKVKQHIYAINGFMEMLEIIPQTPGIDLKRPEMEYMIISVNDSVPFVVGKMKHLTVNKGDTIQVHDVVANYERGLSVDVIGLGNRFNYMKKRLKVTESTRIEAKKDFYKCGSVFIDVRSRQSSQDQWVKVKDAPDVNTLQYKLKINGQLYIADNYSHVVISQGDTLVIEDLLSGKTDPSQFIVNFKGFVGNEYNNSGEDRGYLIDTSKDVLMTRYSLSKKGLHYYILTTLNGKEVGKLFIDIQS